MKLGTLVGSLVVLGTACAVVPDEASERSLERTETLTRWGSPDVCGSGGGASGEPCGPSQCQRGEFCCNKSCGICAPRGGACIQIHCEQPPPPRAQCVDNADCRAVSSYCDGCQCLPAGVLDPDPSCHAPMVACFAEPCHHQHPECVNGLCAIVAN